MISKINNQNGSTLIENIISMTIISIIGMIVLVTMTAGMNMYIKSQSIHQDVDEAYQNMESRVGIDIMDGESQIPGSLDFKYQGEKIEISGNYYWESDSKLGEFISD